MTFTSPRAFIKFLRKTPVKTPNEIYLIPDTEHGHVWSDEPAPTSQHDASEAVRYLKADFVNQQLTNDIERLQAEKAELVDIIECILTECTGLDKLSIREDGCSIDLVKVRELIKKVTSSE